MRSPRFVDRGYPVREVAERGDQHEVDLHMAAVVFASEEGVRAVCRLLSVHPSGFYAWLREAFCQRAL